MDAHNENETTAEIFVGNYNRVSRRASLHDPIFIGDGPFLEVFCNSKFQNISAVSLMFCSDQVYLG